MTDWIKENIGKRQISAMISPEDYDLGRKTAQTWGFLIHLGIQVPALREQIAVLTTENNKLRKALQKLQSTILQSEENGTLL